MKRTHHIKLLAAVTIVMLALSGFSPNRSSGGRGGSSSGGKSHSGGGGCSSKSSSSHSGSSDYDGSSSSSSSSSGGYSDSHRSGSRYNSTTGNHSSSSSNGSSSSRRDGSGSVTKCAAADSARPSATVRVRNAVSRKVTYTVSVKFVDDTGTPVDTGSAVATVNANGVTSVKVPMSNPSEVAEVERCEVLSVR
ncbi:hypothetical protein OIE63_22670 [Streptomyces sp. NBC_01795]|uniref:hypothetical protein n=1 Tax=Streptomyces sp. NBC_01795 TaxID=2975943 RepID=UPI002DD8F497|nr:hypothetical protein [Streptomyces sp. NBC_01795]WSA94068.1 hypothetical protein OIE63_22670 [Streptomyces sp. NBC_01795]